MEFVTDRTQDHVDRLKLLHNIGYYNMSASQKEEYTTYATKGAYNRFDLNRVEGNVAALAPFFGLNLTTKTDWDLWSYPTKSEMDRYLNNVVLLRDALSLDHALPDSMDKLTFETANNIEKILEVAYGQVYPSGEADEYRVAYVLTNAYCSVKTTVVEANSRFFRSVLPNSGYVLESLTVMMNGEVITDGIVFDPEGSTIMIQSVTGPIIVTAVAVPA